MTPEGNGITRLNQAAPAVAAELLAACCASPRWVDRMVTGRPYPDTEALRSAGETELAALDWAEIRTAVDAHPRIGERVTGTGTDAAWSRREHAGMRTASEQTQAAIVAANQAYEQRFGHIFLIFASGRTDAEMLAAARDRQANSDEEERAVVRTELGRIVDLRLQRMAA